MSLTKRIEYEFIHKSLFRYGIDVKREMINGLYRMGINDSGSLKSSIKFDTTSDLGAKINSLDLTFKAYGRMVDMGAGAGSPRTGPKPLSLIEGKAISSRKPRKFYSPIVYGKLNPLIGRLLFGLTQEVIETMKQNLENT